MRVITGAHSTATMGLVPPLSPMSFEPKWAVGNGNWELRILLLARDPRGAGIYRNFGSSLCVFLLRSRN
jgi:hypothetical protein